MSSLTKYMDLQDQTRNWLSSPLFYLEASPVFVSDIQPSLDQPHKTEASWALYYHFHLRCLVQSKSSMYAIKFYNIKHSVIQANSTT